MFLTSVVNYHCVIFPLVTLCSSWLAKVTLFATYPKSANLNKGDKFSNTHTPMSRVSKTSKTYAKQILPSRRGRPAFLHFFTWWRNIHIPSLSLPSAGFATLEKTKTRRALEKSRRNHKREKIEEIEIWETSIIFFISTSKIILSKPPTSPQSSSIDLHPSSFIYYCCSSLLHLGSALYVYMPIHSHAFPFHANSQKGLGVTFMGAISISIPAQHETNGKKKKKT